ncbi:MAG: phosphomannomutase/phosphoglucomutase [Sphaerochaetaceae bacterium]|nr:phosphomannomutase/phosphoglucomutase [Sphaerochaetaceae bacterium]
MGAFHAYDIRGVYNQDFDAETAYKVGFFLTKLIPSKYIVVGRDIRLSSDEIFSNLTKGINDAGVDVWDIGLATTPLVYFATVELDADASVQITASHNPKQYNGMKISRKKAIPVGGDSGLKELEQLVNTETVVPVSPEKRGKIVKKDIYDKYVEFQKKYLPDLSELNLTIDCSNGMSALFAHRIFSDAENIHYINDNLDGSFPNHEPNPLEEKNCRQLEEAVLKNGSDCGIIFDGDADRVIFVDEKGRFIQPDFTTSIIGDYYLEREKGSIYVDVRTSRSTTEYLEKRGATEVIIWKVGHAFAKTKIREKGCIFGGELAGHYYFRDFHFCDSGIFSSLLVLQTVLKLKKEGLSLGSFIDKLVVYANSGEINFRLDRKDECIEEIRRVYSSRKPDRILDFDGYRIEFPSWWFSVRKSNTEPYLRLIVEAATKEELDTRMAELKAIIAQFS